VKPNVCPEHTGKSYSTHIENRNRLFQSLQKCVPTVAANDVDTFRSLDDDYRFRNHLATYLTNHHSFNPLMIFPKHASQIVLSRGVSSSYHIRNLMITFCSSVCFILSSPSRRLQSSLDTALESPLGIFDARRPREQTYAHPYARSNCFSKHNRRVICRYT